MYLVNSMRMTTFALVFMILSQQCNSSASSDLNLSQVSSKDSLEYETIRQGIGMKTGEGDSVVIKELLSYNDGTNLFSTDQIGGSVGFRIGAGHVIEGLDLGIRGMKIGEVRRMVVPPHLSQRTVYPDFLSADSTLVLEVEVLEIYPFVSNKD